jgi:hypothetical protein
VYWRGLTVWRHLAGGSALLAPGRRHVYVGATVAGVEAVELATLVG